jgi:opine dehydrogenase
MKVAVLGAGAGGAAAVVELLGSGHDVVLWNRSSETLAPLQSIGGIRFEGVLGKGLAQPSAITSSLPIAIRGVDAAVVALPTHSHGTVAQALAAFGWPVDRPVILNPGHTGGALEFETAYRAHRRHVPPIAEFSTLTYVARKYVPDCVTVTGKAKSVRVAALPGGESAIAAAQMLFPAAEPVGDVLASDLCNVNMVLHPPGAVLAAAWVEARRGDFTFYVDAMTQGVGRAMKALDDERRAVARAFGHDLPNLIDEMKRIGTVEDSIDDLEDFVAAIAGGEANSRIKAPDSFEHRYYREDFGHGLLPFVEIARTAGVETPVARSLLVLAETMTGGDFREGGRTAEAMGIARLDKAGLERRVRGA